MSDANNDNLVNEYINVLAKKVNDLSLELVMTQTKLNLSTKENESLREQIENLNTKNNKEEVDANNSETEKVRNKQQRTNYE